MSKVDLVCEGGVDAVTGANFFLKTPEGNFLIDCGLYQGFSFSEKENEAPFEFDPREIKALIVTHSHMDHIGRIPKLVKDGFSGIIYSTNETMELARIMFDDAVSLLERASRERGGEPLYNREDVKRTMTLWSGLPYHNDKELTSELDFCLLDAGHILGSAMVVVKSKNKKMIFTGDLGNSPAMLLNDTESPVGADYLLMESVYGDKNHESKGERDEKFVEVVKNTISRGGAVVIPAFSLERTQNILYTLNNLIEDGKLPSVPVFVDSPLAIRVTEIYEKMQDTFKEEIKSEIKKGDDIFDFPKLIFTPSVHESEEIHKTSNPKIILAGSGMSAGGRVTKHEAYYLGDPRSTILLVGYQAVGTLGRRLEEGLGSVEIDGRKIKVKAKIENIRGFSSHKDSDHLVEFVSECKDTVKKVFVTMGEPKSSTFLAQRLKEELDVDAIVPTKSEIHSLEF